MVTRLGCVLLALPLVSRLGLGSVVEIEILVVPLLLLLDLLGVFLFSLFLFKRLNRNLSQPIFAKLSHSEFHFIAHCLVECRL